MKEKIHPKYVDSEIRCACGNVIKTRSTKPVIIVGICNACHPFYTGQQKFVDTAGRVDKFQQRMAKTQAAQAAPGRQEEEALARFSQSARMVPATVRADCFSACASPFSLSWICAPTSRSSPAALPKWKPR